MATIRPTSPGSFSNIDPFGRLTVQRSIPQAAVRGNLAVELYHQDIPRADFAKKLGAIETTLINGKRLGGEHRAADIAQLISSKHLPLNSLMPEILSTQFDPISQENRSNFTDRELSEVLSSDYMKISDAARLLSDRRIPAARTARTMTELFHNPEKLAAILMSPQMSKLRLAQVIDTAFNEERAAGKKHTGHKLSMIMSEMLKNYIPASAAPELLFYVDNDNASEMLAGMKNTAKAERILQEANTYSPHVDTEEYAEASLYNPVQRFGLSEHGIEADPDNLAQLLKDIRTIDMQANIMQSPSEELSNYRLILMRNAANILAHIEPDQAADILGRRNNRMIAEELLSTGKIPATQKARILNSKAFDSDSVCWIMSEMPVHSLVNILEQRDIHMNPIVSYDRLAELLKSRHCTLEKAFNLLRDSGFTRTSFLLANKKRVGDILMNTVLYYFPRQEAIDLIAKSGRNEVKLKEVLSSMYKPALQEPCAP